MIGLVFTPEQFKTLLRMIYVANTVANGASGQKDADYLGEYDDLEQYIFSRAGDAGFPAATWRHRALGEEHHHPSRIFEDDPELNGLMDSYDTSVTELVLAEKLAERDIEEKYGLQSKHHMPAKEYDELLDLGTEAYEHEFYEFGFSRLIIRKAHIGSRTKEKEAEKSE